MVTRETLTCPDCNGTGAVPSLFGPEPYDPCPTCRGTRTVWGESRRCDAASLALFATPDPCGTPDMFEEES